MKRFELTDEQAYCLVVAAGSFLAENPEMLVGALTDGEVDQPLVERATKSVNRFDGRWEKNELPAVRLCLEAINIISAAYEQAIPGEIPAAASDFLKKDRVLQ